MVEELFDGVAFFGVDGKEVRYEVLGGFGDVVPPWRQEGVLSSSYFFGENLDGLVVEGRKAAEESVKHAAHCPHVDTLGVSLILDDLWCCVSYCTTWRHRLSVPHNLRQAEVGKLDLTDATSTDTLDELSFINLVFVVRPSGLWVLGRDKWNWTE